MGINDIATAQTKVVIKGLLFFAKSVSFLGQIQFCFEHRKMSAVQRIQF